MTNPVTFKWRIGRDCSPWECATVTAEELGEERYQHGHSRVVKYELSVWRDGYWTVEEWYYGCGWGGYASGTAESVEAAKTAAEQAVRVWRKVK